MQCGRVKPLSLHWQWKPKDDFVPLKLHGLRISYDVRCRSPPESSFLRPLWCWSRCWSSSCGGGSSPLCPAQASQESWDWTGPVQKSGSLHKQRTQSTKRDWYKHLWQTAMQTCLRASAVLLSNIIQVKDLLYITNHRRIQKRELQYPERSSKTKEECDKNLHILSNILHGM